MCATTLPLGLTAYAEPTTKPDLGAALADLESQVGGRLGVALLDTASGELIGHRLNERFGLCSTFKCILAALVLQDIQNGILRGDRRIAFSVDDMVPYAPIVEKHFTTGEMTVIDLARAAQVTSDNVAANLLLRVLGGPDAFTQRLREAGDDVTRLDRYEPDLNLVPDGEIRDTTTPAAMASTLGYYLTGTGLGEESQATLIGWMRETRTGLRRLRAGLPDDWSAGNKTGSGRATSMVNKANDAAIAWPPGQSPIIITAYYDAPSAYESLRREEDAVLAEVGTLIARHIKPA